MSEPSTPIPTLAKQTAGERLGLIERVRTLVAGAFRQDNRQVIASLGPVINGDRVAPLIGLDSSLSGYVHTLDNYAVKYILNRHGNDGRKRAQGQAALTGEDFELVPDILSSPDHMYYDGRTDIGRSTLIYGKIIVDRIVLVAEVRTGKRQPAVTSMRRIRTDGGGAG